MKVKKLQKYGNESGLMDCKWSSLNAQVTENLLSHPILELGEFPSPIIGPLWGNKNWLPSIKVKKLEKFEYKMGLMDCKWSSLNAPGTENFLSHPILELSEFPSPIIGSLG